MCSTATQPCDYHILVVDDEEMLRSVIQDFLNLLGFENHYMAGDGLEALEIIRNHRVDCMLSDIRMPEMDLEELLVILRAQHPQINVIATSGFNDIDTAFSIFGMGAVDFLGKPLNLDALEQALMWSLGRTALMAAARSVLESGPGADGDPHGGFEPLREALRRHGTPFADTVSHSLRLEALLSRIETRLPCELHFELGLACLLHEVGVGHLMHRLCHEPRKLESGELQLVRAHCGLGGRLLEHALAGSHVGRAVADHLRWIEVAGRASVPPPPEQRLAIWLGILNTIDGYLTDRSDRSAWAPDQVRALLEQTAEQHVLPQLGRLLTQWSAVEDFYREPSPLQG